MTRRLSWTSTLTPILVFLLFVSMSGLPFVYGQGNSTLAIHVSDSSTSEDLENATATVWADGGNHSFSHLTNTTGYTTTETIADGNYTLLVAMEGYLPYTLIFSLTSNIVLEAPLQTPEETIMFNMELLILFATGLVFTLITLFTANLSLGIVAAVIATVSWFTTAGWWLISDAARATSAPGVSWLFFGFGIVTLLFIFIGAFKYYDVIISRKEEPIL